MLSTLSRLGIGGGSAIACLGQIFQGTMPQMPRADGRDPSARRTKTVGDLGERTGKGKPYPYVPSQVRCT